MWLNFAFWCMLLVAAVWSETLIADDQSSQSPAALREFEHSVSSVVDDARSSIVAIVVHASDDLLDPENPLAVTANRYPSRIGIGVISAVEDRQAFILTNAHLIDRSGVSGQLKPIQVFAGIRSLSDVEVFASDPRSDLAVLRVVIPENIRLKALQISDVGIHTGKILIVLGNPKTIVETGQPLMALTICQAVRLRQSQVPDEDPTNRLIHDLGTLARFELGRGLQHSGTVMVDLDGNLSGLVNSLALPSDADDRTALAIPMTGGFERIVQSLLAGYEVEYGFLGISPGTAEAVLPEDLKLELPQRTAALINRVADRSPAQRAGLEPSDLILRVNQNEVLSGDDLIREVGLIGPGETADLLVYRKNRTAPHAVEVKLGKWPVYDDSQIVASRSRYPAWRGLTIDYSTSRRRFLPNQFLTSFPEGVVITHVVSGSPAEQAGLLAGQFLGKVGETPIETPAEFHHAIDQLNGAVMLTLTTGQRIEIPEAAPNDEAKEE